MTISDKLFTPLRLGDVEVPNRILMAPLTRNRAQGDGTPKKMAETYYYQRASAGLIISEATQISAMGKGYLDTPGIYTDEHVAAWRQITNAVHANGGRIFCQLWHVGRISHTSLLPEGRSPVSSTDKAADAQTFTANGFEDSSKPEPLSVEGIKETVQDYVKAAQCALAAGFDGIEVHGANGYLLDQFLQNGVNNRDDAYGGNVENRMRFLLEVLAAVEGIFPPGRIGVRLSPLGQANDMSDSDPEATFGAIYSTLSLRNLAYLHVVESFFTSDSSDEDAAMLKRLRSRYEGNYIANGGYDGERASEAVESGYATAVAFGRPFIANPDLPERIRIGADMNEPNQETFYGGDETGYTDYPFLASNHPTT